MSTRKLKASRVYSPTTLKILFAFSGNQCARPGCEEQIVATATDYSNPKVIGQIAHIYAHSDGGPRSKPNLTDKERCGFDNLLLLCPTHHVTVDTQHESFPADLLIGWKRSHEAKYQASLSTTIANVGFAELEIAAKALMSLNASDDKGSLEIIPPKHKISKNSLGASSTMLLTMGAAKSREVEEVLRKAAQLDAHFPDRLRDGFTVQYSALCAQGITGDELFAEMYIWAKGVGSNIVREATGLCILTHLFIVCDIFEK